MKALKKKSDGPNVKGLLKRLDRSPSKGMTYKQYRDMLGKQLVDGKISHKERNELLEKFRSEKGMPRRGINSVRDRG